MGKRIHWRQAIDLLDVEEDIEKPVCYKAGRIMYYWGESGNMRRKWANYDWQFANKLEEMDCLRCYTKMRNLLPRQLINKWKDEGKFNKRIMDRIDK